MLLEFRFPRDERAISVDGALHPRCRQSTDCNDRHVHTIKDVLCAALSSCRHMTFCAEVGMQIVRELGRRRAAPR
jgi:hypothetical protein